MKKSKSQRDKTKPRRPRCAYNFFFKHSYGQKSREASGGPKPDYRELTRTIGKEWKALSPEERSVFKAQAEEDMKRYKLSKIQWEAQYELGLKATVRSSPAVEVTAAKPSASATPKPIPGVDDTNVKLSVRSFASSAQVGRTSPSFPDPSIRSAAHSDVFLENSISLSSWDGLDIEMPPSDHDQRSTSDMNRLNFLRGRFESALLRDTQHLNGSGLALNGASRPPFNSGNGRFDTRQPDNAASPNIAHTFDLA